MEWDLVIGSSAATSNPCLVVLRDKGYDLEVLDVTDKKIVLYSAFKDGRKFVGHSGPEVLGLVAMWEHLGDDWLEKLPDLPDILVEVIKEVKDEE